MAGGEKRTLSWREGLDVWYDCQVRECYDPQDTEHTHGWASVQWTGVKYCGGPRDAKKPNLGGGGGGGGGGGSGSGGGGGCTGQCCPSSEGGPPSSSVITNSVINVETRTLGEVVPVVGANFSLYYHSGYQAGRLSDFQVKMPLSYATPRDYITSFNMVTSRSGVTLNSQSIPNTANQTYTYTWNGLDSLGNPADSEKLQLTRNEITPITTTPVSFDIELGHWNVKRLGLGGWAPTNLVKYDTLLKRLFYSNGDFKVITAKAYGTSQFYIPSDVGSLVYIFDSTGKHVETKTGLLGTTILSFGYDSSGRLSTITEPFSKVTTFNRNSSGVLVSITSSNGQVSTAVIDSNGYLQSLTNPNSETYSFSYYGTQGMMHTFTKPNGEVSTFTYDVDGAISQDSHSGGYFFDLVASVNPSYDYDITSTTGMGRTTVYQTNADTEASVDQSVQYPSGATNRTIYNKNADGSSSRIDRVGGVETEYSSANHPRYNSDSRTVTAVRYLGNGGSILNYTESATLSDPNDPFSITAMSKTSSLSGTNETVTTVFNPTTKKFTSTTYMGKTSESTIDSYERVVSVKNGNLNAVGINYTNEKITSITQGTRTTSVGYNTAGLMSSITNPLLQTTSYVYDSANRIASKIFPDTRTVTYGYDGVGNLTSVTPPGKPLHQFGINGHGLVGSYQPPVLTGVSVVNTNYTYNLDKQLIGITRPDGSYVNFNYNSSTGKLETFDTAAGTYVLDVDADTKLPRQITSPSGDITFTSIAGNQITGSQNYLGGGSTFAGAYSSTATQFNRVDSDAVQSGGSGSTTSSITYLYNNDGELSKAGDVSITYHVPNGYITGTTMGTGTTGFTDTYTYNTNGEVTGYTIKRGTTTYYTLTLTRDASGRIDSKTQVMKNAALTADTTDAYAYAFDSSGRLQQVTKNSVVASNYGYDSNSNRNSGNVGAQTTTATYDDQDRLKTYNTLSFTYNANGDLVTKTNSTTAQTTTYTYDVFGNLTKVVLPGGTTTITYEIDGLNRRVGKKVNGTVQRRWVYMDQYRIAAELNSAGTITKRFIYGSKGNIPDYVVASGVKYRIISDQLGSPRLVVNQSTGAIQQRIDHDEFGRVIEDSNPGFLPFGFAGGLYDYQTGIVRFGARDYDPEYARWTSKDPISFRGGDENLFGYVAQEPVNDNDPSGLAARCKRKLEGFKFMWGPFFHEYFCYNVGGETKCKGLTPVSGNGLGTHPGPGRLEDDAPNSSCKNIGAGCMDTCLADYVSAGAPNYNLGVYNCKDYVSDAVNTCTRLCGGSSK
jgi:RHS repeat-associated protein